MTRETSAKTLGQLSTISTSFSPSHAIEMAYGKDIYFSKTPTCFRRKYASRNKKRFFCVPNLRKKSTHIVQYANDLAVEVSAIIVVAEDKKISLRLLTFKPQN